MTKLVKDIKTMQEFILILMSFLFCERKYQSHDLKSANEYYLLICVLHIRRT